MKITNKHKLPESIVSAIKLHNDEYDNEGSDLSASSISIPPRIYWLNKRHHNEITLDALDLFRSFIGTAVHAACEYAAKKDSNILAEERFSTEILGWKVSAKIDRYNRKKQLLTDLKFSSIYALTNPPKFEYEAQLNTQKYLLELHGIPVKKMELDISGIDWYASKAIQEGYPKLPCKAIEIPEWGNEKTEQYITERVTLLQSHVDTPDDDLPKCSAEDMWEKPTQFAVMKHGGKRAVKLFDVGFEADIYLKQNKIDGYVEIRQGERIRCESYCQVATFCNQYKEYCEKK